MWRKYEQLPGLMMSRSFGDVRAHTCGVISTPEIRNFPLDKTARAIVLGSDGMWEVLTIEKIRTIVAKYYKSKRSDEAASELLEASQAGWSKKVALSLRRILCTATTSPVSWSTLILTTFKNKQINSLFCLLLLIKVCYYSIRHFLIN